MLNSQRNCDRFNLAFLQYKLRCLLDNQPNIVEITDVVFCRGDRKIYDGVSLHIKTGKVTAIMGPSGCGKTTLLRMIGGQLKPSAGTVTVFGQDIASLSRDELTRLRAGGTVPKWCFVY